jgi:prolipoprotein diacylglyceryltransferase
VASDFGFDHGRSAAGYQNVGQRKAVVQPTQLHNYTMNKTAIFGMLFFGSESSGCKMQGLIFFFFVLWGVIKIYDQANLI